MAKRMLLMLALVAVVVAGLGFVKYRQIQAASQTVMQPPPEAVTTIVAKEEKWPATLSAIGSAVAVQGVTVSADLPGTVARIAFESGQSVKEGDVLVELDTRQERAQLANVEAQRDLAHINFNRTQELVKQGVIAQMEYDNVVAQQKATEAQVGEIRATIARKTIRAPFSGILGIRQINLGQYLAAGEAIVSLQSLNPIYVNFGVPQQEGAKVTRRSHGSGYEQRRRWNRVYRAGYGHRLGGERVNAKPSGTGHACQSWRQIASRHVCAGRDGVRGGSFGYCASDDCHQLCAVWRFGLRRFRPQGPSRQDLPRGAPAGRQA